MIHLIIAKYAEENHTFLEDCKDTDSDKYNNILKGKEPVWFKKPEASKWSNKVDEIVYLVDEPDKPPKNKNSEIW